MHDGFENERLVMFENGIFVLARCPKCCRFLKHGKVISNDETYRCEGWACKVHGEVEPLDSGFIE